MFALTQPFFVPSFARAVASSYHRFAFVKKIFFKEPREAKQILKNYILSYLI